MQPITQSIPANNNLLIQTVPDSWQLLIRAADGLDQAEPPPLVTANERGLNYPDNFAQARHLPADGLPSPQIETVIVGWERKDGCWYLGLLLDADLAVARGGRWLGLARWSDPTGLIEFQAAETAGRTLADTVRRPFRLVTDQLRPEMSLAPTDSSKLASDLLDAEGQPLETPKLSGVQPAVLPVAMGDWTLAENENGLVWEHSRGWRTGMIARLLFFAGLTLLFIVLSVGGLSSIFAPVQPDWLPLVGLVVAVVVGINAVGHGVRLISTESVEFDKRLQMVRWHHTRKGVMRQVPFEKVQYLLLSYSVLRAEHLKGTTPANAFDQVTLENWLHVARDIGDFIECGHVALVEGRAVHQYQLQPRHPLDLTEIDTPVQHAAQLIATLMAVPAFVEQR